MIDKEAELLSNYPAVGDRYSQVVIGRLSQGCAASVFCLFGGDFLLREDGESKPLGGFIGMSGWLPFEGEIARLLKIDKVILENQNQKLKKTTTTRSPRYRW